MELRDVEYFAVVAENGHLGRAAEALGISQPALSKSLGRLEAVIGAKLVRRTSKGVELTAEGPREELEAFRKGIREAGLEHFIRNEDVSWNAATGEFRGFEIVR